MKRVILLAGCVAAACLCLTTCKIPGSSSPSSPAASIPTVFLTDYNGDFSYSLDVGSDKHDVYFVFSNKSVDTSATSASVKNAVGSIKVNGATIAESSSQPAGGPSTSSTKAKDFLARSNRDIISAMSSGGIKVSGSSTAKIASPSAATEGSTGGFYDLDSLDYWSSVPSTCRLVRTASTNQGSRTLNIWVANDCYDTGSTKKHAVTSGMVTALADAFLNASGNQKDIYDWDTEMLGPEWGAPQGAYASELIPYDGSITILLSDIEQDNSDTGGTVGYFWAGNNFQTAYESGSNARIMFVVDAVMFANASATKSGSSSSGWSISSSYWAKYCLSTLAHEFQHMIQFYRKGVLVRGDCQSADTWINEMCSQLVEDLVSKNFNDELGISVNGPRGVAPSDGTAGSAGNTDGRLPYFNAFLDYDDRQLTKTSDYDAYDYSFSYAFGAWLARNFGGAQFVRNVVYDSNTDSTCITDAVRAYSGRSLSMGDLISRWAVAVLASDRSDMPVGYRYNTGDWVSSSVNGTSYSLGSIDFFNYSPVPQIYTGSGSTPSIAASSNVYYKALGSDSGSHSWSLSLPQGVSFGVYVTP